MIVGDGEDRDMYENMVKELDLKNVFFEGVQQPQPYYQKAKIFAMTSSWEGLPMTIIESFQMGVVPVVMDSFPAAKDMILDGENGYLVSDSEKFVAKVESLMNCNNMCMQMALKARKSSMDYSINFIGKTWCELLKK